MNRWAALTSLILLVGCGSEGEFKPQMNNKNPKSVAPGQQDNADVGGILGGSNTTNDKSTGSSTPKSEQPIPPVPVTGTYIVAIAVGEAGEILANAEVTLEETGATVQKAISNTAGQVRLNVSIPANVVKLSVKRRGSSLINVANLSDAERARISESLNTESTNPNFVAPRAVQLKSSASQPTLAVTSIGNPAGDQKAPVIFGVNTSPSANGKLVRVNASDAESGLHERAYSFDGGVTWTAINESEFASGTTIPSGTIQVRDRALNISKYTINLGI